MTLLGSCPARRDYPQDGAKRPMGLADRATCGWLDQDALAAAT